MALSQKIIWLFKIVYRCLKKIKYRTKNYVHHINSVINKKKLALYNNWNEINLPRSLKFSVVSNAMTAKMIFTFIRAI